MIIGLGLGLQFKRAILNKSFIAQYGQPAVGLSFRDLLGTDPVIALVRRDSDDAELAFKVSEITDGTLLTWVGAGNDGLVRTMYSQGNSITAQQATASKQPLLVINGVLQTENGLPIMRRNGADGGMLMDYDVDDAVARSFFYVGKNPAQNFVLLGSSSGGNDFGYFGLNGGTGTNYNVKLTTTNERLNLAPWSPSTLNDVYDNLINQFLLVIQCSFNYDQTGLSLGYRFNNPANLGMADTQEVLVYENNTDNAGKEADSSAYWMPPSFLLEQGGGFLLQENGSKIIL
jgi:hypothetical protein